MSIRLMVVGHAEPAIYIESEKDWEIVSKEIGLISPYHGTITGRQISIVIRTINETLDNSSSLKILSVSLSLNIERVKNILNQLLGLFNFARSHSANVYWF